MERVLPPKYEALRRRVVPLGKFGVDEDFRFDEHNATTALTALDNSMPNAYCNVVLLMLYMLPWLRVHCLNSLMRSQCIDAAPLTLDDLPTPPPLTARASEPSCGQSCSPTSLASSLR
jgi:hypothetical protein